LRSPVKVRAFHEGNIRNSSGSSNSYRERLVWQQSTRNN
jgi:hypothetical protein